MRPESDQGHLQHAPSNSRAEPDTAASLRVDQPSSSDKIIRNFRGRSLSAGNGVCFRLLGGFVGAGFSFRASQGGVLLGGEHASEVLSLYDCQDDNCYAAPHCESKGGVIGGAPGAGTGTTTGAGVGTTTGIGAGTTLGAGSTTDTGAATSMMTFEVTWTECGTGTNTNNGGNDSVTLAKWPATTWGPITRASFKQRSESRSRGKG